MLVYRTYVVLRLIFVVRRVSVTVDGMDGACWIFVSVDSPGACCPAVCVCTSLGEGMLPMQS